MASVELGGLGGVFTVTHRNLLSAAEGEVIRVRNSAGCYCF